MNLTSIPSDVNNFQKVRKWDTLLSFLHYLQIISSISAGIVKNPLKSNDIDIQFLIQ